MRRLTLHIGGHKTGTTTLQETFLANKTALAKQGLGYAHAPASCHLHSYLSVIDPVSVLTQGFGVVDPALFAKDLAATPSDDIFGSSENFAFFFFQAPIDALAKALLARFDQVRILAYLRRQDRHALSHHQEGARPDRLAESQLWGHALSALPKPQPHQKLYLNYDRRLALWENAFGRQNVTLRIYDRNHLKNGDIVSDVLDVLGLSAKGIEPIEDRNLSLGLQRAKVGHLANDILGQDHITRALLRALPNKGQKMLPSAQEARAFLAPYRASNRALNERHHLSRFPDLFPDDFDDFPAEALQAWPDDAANEALRAVISVLGRGQTTFSDLTHDDLRKAAEALAPTDAPTALRLITAAQALRPDSGQINRLKTQLETQQRQSNGV